MTQHEIVILFLEIAVMLCVASICGMPMLSNIQFMDISLCELSLDAARICPWAMSLTSTSGESTVLHFPLLILR